MDTDQAIKDAVKNLNQYIEIFRSLDGRIKNSTGDERVQAFDEKLVQNENIAASLCETADEIISNAANYNLTDDFYYLLNLSMKNVHHDIPMIQYLKEFSIKAAQVYYCKKEDPNPKNKKKDIKLAKINELHKFLMKKMKWTDIDKKPSSLLLVHKLRRMASMIGPNNPKLDEILNNEEGLFIVSEPQLPDKSPADTCPFPEQPEENVVIGKEGKKKVKVDKSEKKAKGKETKGKEAKGKEQKTKEKKPKDKKPPKKETKKAPKAVPIEKRISQYEKEQKVKVDAVSAINKKVLEIQNGKPGCFGKKKTEKKNEE